MIALISSLALRCRNEKSYCIFTKLNDGKKIVLIKTYHRQDKQQAYYYLLHSRKFSDKFSGNSRQMTQDLDGSNPHISLMICDSLFLTE